MGLILVVGLVDGSGAAERLCSINESKTSHRRLDKGSKTSRRRLDKSRKTSSKKTSQGK